MKAKSRLGATYLGDSRCQFVVWAPFLSKVEVHIISPVELVVLLEKDDQGYHQAVVDGIEPGNVREILDMEISTVERQARQAAKIWEAAGGYAPTIGIIGAVLGLIHVMENLSDPSRLGSGIAVAFVATIYGVGLANLVFLPIANKLKTIIANQVARQEMMADVFFSIASGDNGRVIQERVSAYR